MSQVLPVIIRGPAIVTFNSMVFYVRGDIRDSFKRETFTVEDDFHGIIGVRSAGHGMRTITFQPAGELKTLAKYWPYGPSSLVAGASAIGGSIFTGPLVIHTKAGKTYTYPKAGMARMPSLFLGTKKPIIGPMEFHVIGDYSTTPTDTDFFETIASSAFSDTSFDAAKIVYGLYSAALGSRSAPYNAIGAREGFTFEPTITLEQCLDDNVGVADELLTSVSWRCKFAPNNLTREQLDTLVQLQDTNVILPGEDVGRGPGGTPEDLVVSGPGLTATLHKAGIVSTDGGFGTKIDVNGEIEFANSMSFTTGVANALVTLTLAS